MLQLYLCALAVLALAGAIGPPDSDRGASAAHHPREFAPGVRIDWHQRVVEVDATVVLRKGALELLACSPQTREHESVLSVRARPMHIFQAMGLIGLEPGSPVRYDEQRDRFLPPTGTPLELRVRYRHKGVNRTVPAERWLLDVERRRPPESVNWVFAGSRTFDDGRFAADVDGTIICVVDFDTALITVGSLHTSDNRHLWLAANTEAIPPVKTSCTLLIRGANKRIVEVEVTPDGMLRHKDRPLTEGELLKTVLRGETDASRTTVVLRPSAQTSTETIESVVASLARVGIDRTSIEIRQTERSRKKGQPPQ